MESGWDRKMESCPGPDKRSLRSRVRERRALLSARVREEESASITRRVLDLVGECSTVMAYASKPPEVDTHPLLSFLIQRGVRVVVPIIERSTGTLRISYLRDLTRLVTSTFQVPEPIGHEIPAPADEIEAAIIPLIAFDRQGNRLGYGAGYYDRFLGAHPRIRKIGVAFSVQEEPFIPHEPNDVRMDLIVTEKEIISCSHPCH